MEHENSTSMGQVKQMFKLVAYADDVKPAITSMAEFSLVDRACTLLERASGVKLHRNPDSGKVKFLALGRWRGTLVQEDLPHQYVRLSDHLDFIGVELRSTFTQTLGTYCRQESRTLWDPGRLGTSCPSQPTAMPCPRCGSSAVW